MKKFAATAVLAFASAIFAQETTAIQNVCDSLALGGHARIELVPAYIQETNWYGDIRTQRQDSSRTVYHSSYEPLLINIKKGSTLNVPISIKAECRETEGNNVTFAVWNSSQKWVKDEVDDYATGIYNIRWLEVPGHDSTNTNNLLAFLPGSIPADYSFQSNQLLFSETFEFAFEWWFVGASYTETIVHDSLHSTLRHYYGSSTGNDSLRVLANAVKALKVPDSISTVRLQVLKVVLTDSRKPIQPESSSSSQSPVSCSSAESSSSSSNIVPPSSSSSVIKSSSSSAPKSSSSDVQSCSSTVASSSSQASSSSKVTSSSSDTPKSSSSAKPASSSSDAKSSSSAKQSSSSKAKSSSSQKDDSSSSESSRIVLSAGTADGLRMLQVRRLDGSIVRDGKMLDAGVYYVKYSDGLWRRTAVLSK